MLPAIVLVVLGVISPAARAIESATPYAVLKVEGAEAKNLYTGEEVRTDANQKAVIEFKDGTVIELGGHTVFKVGANARHEIVQGWSRAKVATPAAPKEMQKAIKKQQPFKFFMRSKNAVLGVRGTTFEVLAGDSFQVLTREGHVEVAQNEAALLADQGVEVAAGHAVVVDAAGVGQPFPSTSSTLVAPETSPEASVDTEDDDPLFEFLNFRVGAILTNRPPAPMPPQGSKPQLGPMTGAPYVSFSPFFRLPFLRWIGIRAQIGFAPLESGVEGRNRMFELAVLANVDLLSFLALEAGAGYQNWKDAGVDGPMPVLGAGLILSRSGFFSRLIAQVAVPVWRRESNPSGQRFSGDLPQARLLLELRL